MLVVVVVTVVDTIALVLNVSVVEAATGVLVIAIVYILAYIQERPMKSLL